jgi:hypothetical protein
VADSFVNSSFPPRRLDVEGWGMLGPGERAMGVEPTDHNKGLVEAGDLTRIREEAALKSLEKEQAPRTVEADEKGDK